MLDELLKNFHKPELLNFSLFKDSTDETIFNFLNFHILKATLARIVGLIHLLKSENSEHYEEIMERLEFEVEDLRLSIGEIKSVMEHLLDRHDKKKKK